LTELLIVFIYPVPVKSLLNPKSIIFTHKGSLFIVSIKFFRLMSLNSFVSLIKFHLDLRNSLFLGRKLYLIASSRVMLLPLFRGFFYQKHNWKALLMKNTQVQENILHSTPRSLAALFVKNFPKQRTKINVGLPICYWKLNSCFYLEVASAYWHGLQNL
jgi:hypothetical protein